MINIKPPVWAKALGIVAVAIGITLAISAYNGRLIDIGKAAERSAWQGRESAELAAANARILKLTAAARQAEQDHAAALARVSATYQEQLQHEKKSRDRTIADLRSGALRLRIELARRETAGGSAIGEAGASAGGCDGASVGELSDAAAEFLVDLTAEADDVVHQLTACQAVLVADRQINSEGESK
jgi:hypothetical protein